MRLFPIVPLVAFLTASSGCAFHRPMPRPLTPAAVSEVQWALASRGAWVEYQEPGRPPIVDAVQQGSFRVARTRPSLILLTDEPPHAVPLEQVRSIQINNHWVGAAEGLGVGFLSGLLLGAVLAPNASSSCSPGDDHCLGMDFSGEVLATSLLVGTLVGGAIGAAVGQRYVYTF